MATPFHRRRRAGTVTVLPLLWSGRSRPASRASPCWASRGEAHRLTDDERRQVVETVGQGSGAVASRWRWRPWPRGTHLAAALARMAQDSGAQALMLAPPTGSRNLDAVLAYTTRCRPPPRCPSCCRTSRVTTQLVMPPAFIGRVVAEIPRIEAVKLEESPTLPKITRLRARVERRVSIFGGWAAATSSRSCLAGGRLRCRFP